MGPPHAAEPQRHLRGGQALFVGVAAALLVLVDEVDLEDLEQLARDGAAGVRERGRELLGELLLQQQLGKLIM